MKQARTILGYVLLAVAIRVLFLQLIPSHWYSLDMKSWNRVIFTLAAGRNPYQDLEVLNWGPAWMMILSMLDWFRQIFGGTLSGYVRGLLILADGLMVALLLVLSQIEHTNRSQYLLGRQNVMWGYVLHPVPILLCCQHLNFDILWLLLLLLGIYTLLAAPADHDGSYWLLSCLLFGLALLIKTPALFCFPLLFVVAKQRTKLQLFIGVWLLVFPIVLGLGILFVLAPQEVTRNVLLYSSAVSVPIGLAWLSASFGLTSVHQFCCLLIMLVVEIFILRIGLKLGKPSLQFFVKSFFVIYGVLVLFGPGFGVQYILWLLVPLVLLTNVSTQARRLVWLLLALGYPVIYAETDLLGGSVDLVLVTKSELVVALLINNMALVGLFIVFVDALWKLKRIDYEC